MYSSEEKKVDYVQRYNEIKGKFDEKARKVLKIKEDLSLNFRKKIADLHDRADFIFNIRRFNANVSNKEYLEIELDNCEKQMKEKLLEHFVQEEFKSEILDKIIRFLKEKN